MKREGAALILTDDKTGSERFSELAVLTPLVFGRAVIQTPAVWLHAHALSCSVTLTLLQSPSFVMHYLFICYIWLLWSLSGYSEQSLLSRCSIYTDWMNVNIFIPLGDQNVHLTLSFSFMDWRDMRLGEVRSPRPSPQLRVLIDDGCSEGRGGSP